MAGPWVSASICTPVSAHGTILGDKPPPSLPPSQPISNFTPLWDVFNEDTGNAISRYLYYFANC